MSSILPESDPSRQTAMARVSMKKTLAIIINSIGYGGAEHVLINVLNSIGPLRASYEIHVIILDDDDKVRELPDYVVQHTLNSRHSLALSIVLASRCLVKI